MITLSFSLPNLAYETLVTPVELLWSEQYWTAEAMRESVTAALTTEVAGIAEVPLSKVYVQFAPGSTQVFINIFCLSVGHMETVFGLVEVVANWEERLQERIAKALQAHGSPVDVKVSNFQALLADVYPPVLTSSELILGATAPLILPWAESRPVEMVGNPVVKVGFLDSAMDIEVAESAEIIAA